MESVKALLNTSVADARSTLECQLLNNPAQALADATACLAALIAKNDDRHRSRRAMLSTIANKARKQLSQ